MNRLTLPASGLLPVIALLCSLCAAALAPVSAAAPAPALTAAKGAAGPEGPAGSEDPQGSESAPLRVAVVVEPAGMDDPAFSRQVYRSLLAEAPRLGVEVTLVEPSGATGYEPSLEMLAGEGFSLIWVFGGQPAGDAVARVAPRFPQVGFVLADGTAPGANVLTLRFGLEEGAFLAGVLAGTWSRTGKVGFIGGVRLPAAERLQAAFEAGVEAVRPGAGDGQAVLVGYAGSFDDPAKGKELALAQFAQGVDVIYHAAGLTALGVLEAARETGSWVIGTGAAAGGAAGAAAAGTGHAAAGAAAGAHNPSPVLATVVKRLDQEALRVTEAATRGEFEGGVRLLGLAEGAVELVLSADLAFPEEVLEVVETHRQRIAAGLEGTPSRERRPGWGTPR